MADEVVKYSFEGDSSNLANAAEKAISSLDKVENSQNAVTRALAPMQNAMRNASNGAKALSSSMNQAQQSGGAASAEMKRLIAMLSSTASGAKLATPLLGSSSSAIQGLTTSSRNLGAELSKTIAPIQQTRKGVTSLTTTATQGAAQGRNFYTNWARIGQNAMQWGKSFKQACSTISSALQRVGKVVNSTIQVITRLVSALQLGKIIGGAITAHNDYIEAMNMFTVAAGDQKDVMQDNLDVLSEYGGLARSTLTEAAGGYKLLAQEMGVTAETSAKMANNLTNATVDLASMFNKEFVDVANDMNSALQGMTKSARKYGIDISEAGLKTTAAQLGIDKNVESMTQAEKVQLRYATIIRQTSLAQGDFARTIESPANMIKIFKEQLVELKVSLGAVFDTLLRAVMPVLITFVVVLQKVFNALAALTGYRGFEPIANSAQNANNASAGIADNMGEAAKKAKEAKKQLAGFDELNNVSSSSTSSDSGGVKSATGGMDLGNILPTYDNMLALSDFMPNIRKRADEIYKSFAAWAKPIKDAFAGIKEPVTTAFNSIKASFGNLGKTFANLIQKDLIQNVAPGLANLAPVIASLISNFSQLFQAISPILLTLSGFAWDILTAVLNTFSQIIGKVAGAFQEWQGPLDTTFQTLREGLGEVVATLGSMVMPMLDTLLPVLMSLFTSIVPPLMDVVKVITKLIADLFKTLWPIVSCLIELLAPILEVIVNVISSVVGIIAPIISILVKVLNFALAPIVAILKVAISVINAVLKVVNAVVQGIQKAFGGLFQWLDKKITGFLNGFIGFLNKLLGGVETGINFLLKGVNAVIRWINKIPGFNISELHVSIPRIPKFATGGFPEDGLFYANHNEMVGSFSNGKTAVANNEQIIEGIRRGVYDGVIAAMGRQDGGDFVVKIGEDVLFRVIRNQAQNYRRRTGKPAFA